MQKTTYILPPSEKIFSDITNVYCGEGFTALDNSISEFSVWFIKENNDSAKADILQGGMFGKCIYSALIPAGSAGKKTVNITDDLFLIKDEKYFIRVSKGAPGMTTGSLAAFNGMGTPSGKGQIIAHQTDMHMALELVFVHRSGTSSIVKEDPVIEPEYINKVNSLLKEKVDIAGEALIAQNKLSYDEIKDLLKPLMLVGTYLTDSGIYYTPLGYPGSLSGEGDFALCVADGSQIISSAADGRKITFYIDYERFGNSLSKLETPCLLKGYLPCLINEYQDISGNIFIKETFTGRVEETEQLVAFVKIEKIHSNTSPLFKIRVSDLDYVVSGNKLILNDKVYMIFSHKPVKNGEYVEFNLEIGSPLYIVRYNHPSTSGSFKIDKERYDRELEIMTDFWEEKLLSGTVFNVPEEEVMNAKKNLIIQNLCFGYRYSIGNQYEDFFQPESSDSADILGSFGYIEVYRAILSSLINKFKPKAPYGNWERGEKLAHGARYYAMTGDFSFIEENVDTYCEYMDQISEQILRNPENLPDKQVFSGDISKPSLYIHWLCVIYRGFKDMYSLLETQNLGSVKKYALPLKLFEESLKKRIYESLIEIDENTVFIPHTLSEEDTTWFDPITKTRIGSYWNLCIHYALTSGIIPYASDTASKIYNYMKNYGTWLLGLLRFNYYPVENMTYMEGGLPGYAAEGADNVYAINLAEFVSHMNDPERLILMFYSKLAHGMTRGTYISGEGDTIGVYPGEYYRSMYLPPSSANNSLFLKLLRIMLLNERYDADFVPVSLDICPAVPLHWLEDKKVIEVLNAPTLFGPVSFTCTSGINTGNVNISVEFPTNTSLKSASVFIRLPDNFHIKRTLVNGSSYNYADKKIVLDKPAGKYDILFEV